MENYLKDPPPKKILIKPVIITVSYLLFSSAFLISIINTEYLISKFYVDTKTMFFLLGMMFLFGSAYALYGYLKKKVSLSDDENLKLQLDGDLYNIIVDDSKDVVWKYDLKLDKFNFASPSVEQLLGYTVEEIRNKSFSEIIAPEYHYLFKDFYTAQKRSGESRNRHKAINRFHAISLTKSGRPVSTEIAVMINRNAFGKAASLTGITRNLDDKRIIRERLKYSEFVLRESQKIAGLGHYDFDLISGKWNGSKVLKRIFCIDGNYENDVKGWLNLICEEDRDKVAEDFENGSLLFKKNVDRSYRIKRHCDGQIRWIHEQAKYHYDGSGRPVRLLGIIHDITDQKNIERNLLESNERYRSVVASLHEGVVLHSADGRILTVNKAAEKILGFSVEEIMGGSYAGKSWKALREDGSDFPAEMHPAAVTLRTGVPQTNVVMGLQKSEDRIIWISINSEPLFSPGVDKPSAVVTSFSDITEKQIAHLAVKQSENKYRDLFENNLAGVFRTSVKGELLDCNRAFAEILGFKSKEELLNKSSILDFYYSKEDRDRYVNLLLSKGQLTNFEGLHKKVDGSRLWALENIRVVKDNEGLPAFIEGTIIDITALKEAEMQIIKERNQTQLYFDTAGVMFAHLDTDGKVTHMNKKGLEILEYSADDIIGKNWFDLVIPVDINLQIRNVFRELIANENPLFKYNENEVVCKSGKIRILAFYNTVIKDDKGNVLGILFSGVDITEQKTAQEALRDSRARLIKAQQVARMGFIDWNLSSNEIYWSDEVCVMYGKNKGENKQTIESTLKLTHPDDAEFVRSNIENAVKNEQKYNIDHKMLRPDGSIIWVHAQGEIITDEDGRPVTLLGTVVDITDRKNAESALRESEDRYRRLVEYSPDGFIIHQAGEIVFVNAAALKIFKAESHSDLIGKSTLEIVHPDYKLKVINRLRQVLKSGRTQLLLEKRLIRLDGTAFDAEVTAISTEYRGRTAIQIMIRDITERKLAEKELEKYRKELERLVKLRTDALDEANARLREEIDRQKEIEMMLRKSLDKEKDLNELKSTFISTTSHEFRTPLTTVLSSVELIQMFGRKWSDEKLNEYFAIIKNSIENLTKLLDDVLTISRSERGKIDFNPQKLNLKEFCRKLVEETRLKSDKKHNIVFNYDIKYQEVKADRALLRFILANLLSNAVKYSPDGGKIELAVRENEEQIEFWVEDEGMGIPEEDRKYLFEPFQRGKNSVNFEGTGLGLSIAKLAADIHGGEISFLDNSSNGSTFKVIIPKRE